MKRYEVFIGDTAWSELESAYRRIAERAPASAVEWFNGCIDAVRSLEILPERCPLAPEDDHFNVSIRQRLYGSARRPYRILYTIRGGAVHVLHVRHGSRDVVEPEGNP